MRIMFLFLLLLGFPLLVFTQNKPFLSTELAELESYLPYRDSVNVAVSKVGVAWHIDHSLKVINQIINSLEKSDPSAFKPNINFLRGIVFTTNNMPRGVGKAGTSVMPPEVIHTEDILSQFSTVRQRLLTFDSLPTKSNFKHPVFGLLKKKKSKRFFVVHTTHHLKIIRDILAQ